MKKNGIKLNLIMTYPIRWSIEHIMQDYVQNFYDALGAEKFSEDFVYMYDEERRELRMEGKKGFHIEWLQYIGVSDKHDSSRYTAGKFGEGFKIASLCAYRDCEMNIHMESQDWVLNVVKIPGRIDDRDVEFLGYDIEERAYKDNAVLLLGNVNEKAYQKFLKAVNRFFYPENPIFGECIISTDDYAIYRINPSEFAGEYRVNGKVFAQMQERAEISGIPIAFCNHRYESDIEDDRDRERFRYHDIENAVDGVVSKLEGEELRDVFMAFQPYWQGRVKRDTSGPDWSRLIRKMIWKICGDDVIAKKVKMDLEGKYLTDIPYYIIKHDQNKYRTAVEWFRTSAFHEKYKILPYYFSDLNILSIYDLCESCGGFHIINEPDELQQRRIQILEKMAWDIFSDLFVYDKLPKCRVIVNKGTPHEGFATTYRADVPIRSKVGLKVVSNIKEINLRKELFYQDAFPEAMVVYMHEILHQFGGDASRQFRIAILAMDYRIMTDSGKLEIYEKRWLNADDKLRN